MDNEKFQELILAQFEKMNKQFVVMDKRFEQMDKRFEQMDKRFEQMDKRFDKVEQEISVIKTQVIENTRILKALEHLAEVNKAEHDHINGEIRHIKGNIGTAVDECIEDYLGRKAFRVIAVNE